MPYTQLKRAILIRNVDEDLLEVLEMYVFESWNKWKELMEKTKDDKELEQFADLFSVFNKYNSLGVPNDIYDYLLLIWVGSIAEKGSINWLFEKGEELNEEEEIKLLTSICLKNNTVLAGYKSKQYPLIESTAPTFILQSAQNLKELIIAKDLKEEYDIYTPLLKQLKKIY